MNAAPKASDSVLWTAAEALACAYCWAEFALPEHRPYTPESYWLGISEQARNECRHVANDLLLLAVARGHAVALPPLSGSRPGQFEAVKSALGLKSERRVRTIWSTIYTILGGTQ